MRTLLAIIGAFALGFVAIIGVFFVIGMQRVGPLLEAAHSYTDEAVPAITTEWNGEELWSRAAPELKELLQNGGLEQLMTAGSFQLGRLVNYNKTTCELTAYEMRTGSGERALAQCVGKAEYEKAIAGYTLNITKQNDEWKILGFFVIAEEATDQPVTVSYRSQGTPDANGLGLTVNKISIGVSSSEKPEAGAEIRTNTKIENFTP